MTQADLWRFPIQLARNCPLVQLTNKYLFQHQQQVEHLPSQHHIRPAQSFSRRSANLARLLCRTSSATLFLSPLTGYYCSLLPASWQSVVYNCLSSYLRHCIYRERTSPLLLTGGQVLSVAVVLLSSEPRTLLLLPFTDRARDSGAELVPSRTLTLTTTAALGESRARTQTQRQHGYDRVGIDIEKIIIGEGRISSCSNNAGTQRNVDKDDKDSMSENFQGVADRIEDLALRGRGGRNRRGGGGGRRGGGGGGAGGSNRQVQISKALSTLLRHQAQNAGIQLDAEGFAPLDQVVSNIPPLSLSLYFVLHIYLASSGMDRRVSKRRRNRS